MVHMLKIPFLRNILLVALLFATAFPLYDLLYLIPSYEVLVTREAEREAVRFVRFMVISNNLEHIELSAATIPASMGRIVRQLQREEKLVKLRVFSEAGQIVFSTDAQELGQVNTKRYFKEVVAKGRSYSKLVSKESVTAEGESAAQDMVETYVPVMADEQFHGAMEVYYDISDGRQNLLSLAHQSFMSLLLAAAGLLLMTLIVLFRAYNSFLARERAEVALQRSYAELEDRVRQRTQELAAANQRLATEIVERRKAQQAQNQALDDVTEARDRIDAIVSSVADALLVTDQSDEILLFNPAAEVLFSVSAHEVLGRLLPDVIGYDDLLLNISKAKTRLWHNDSVEFDFEMTAQEERRIYQGRVSRLRDAHAGSRGLILMIHDVTRERQIERMKSEFVSMAAHELQTPLTMVLGYSELLLEKEHDFNAEQRREFLEIVNEKSIELSALIDDILDLSRIEDGRGLLLEFNDIDLARLCREQVVAFEQASLRHVFKTDIPDAPLNVNADSVRISQVLGNLLSNAVKYSPEGGTIRITLGLEENWAKLAVVDEGIGMSEEERQNAFERFYRADASNTAVRGAGLGLSIAKYIIDAHGGQIEIFSRSRKGTCVEIRLPLRRS